MLIVLSSTNDDRAGVCLGTICRKLFNHALKLDVYNDADDNPLIGETSKI